MACPFCDQPKPAAWLGYLPLYRECDAKPVVIVLWEDMRERANDLALHERIVIGREKQKGDMTWIQPAMEKGPAYTSSLAYRMRKQDVTDSLLTMWAQPALTSWYRKLPATKGPAMREVKAHGWSSKKPTTGKKPEVSAMYVAAMKRAEQLGKPTDSLEDIMPFILPRPSTNGKH